MSRSLLLAILLLFYYSGICQVLPVEGSSLNYTLIGFSFPAVAKSADKQRIEIAAGNYYSKDSFCRHIIKNIPCKGNKIIGRVPSFGCDYTWRSVTTESSGKVYSGLHHFKTSAYSDVDTTMIRLRIMETAKKYKDAYIFLDANRTMYDMNGHPVWYLPGEANEFGSNTRDIKVSPAGTITFLVDEQVYEVSYNGALIWKGPDDGRVSGEEREYYHHEFTRLGNGHYMVLGGEFIYTKPSEVNDSALTVFSRQKEDSGAMHTLFGTIIEYDKHGNVVWSWKSSEYFKHSDLNRYRSAPTSMNIGLQDTHENAFYFDELNKIMYVSFRNISRLVKIKYPEGTVLNEYGEKFKTGVAPQGNGLFCNQHACKRSAIGCLFLFNNNGCNAGAPKVKKLAESATSINGLKKIWEYTCPLEDGAPGQFSMGGNVAELPDQSMFVCMGSQYSKVFIVNTDKKILWSALPEKWDAETKKWMPVPEYRASIVYDRKQLERLIWNSSAPVMNKKKAVVKPVGLTAIHTKGRLAKALQ